MKTILFQGDSITDCGRKRDLLEDMGTGYPLLVKAQLGLEQPGEYRFINRGVSGNRVVDLYARIKADIINLRPDCISFLIGVNDVWHEFGGYNGVDAAKFEKIYTMLLEEVIAALPNVKIMLMEPFCLRASATDSTEAEPDKWNIFSREVKKRAERVKKVAAQFGASYISLQEKLEQAARTTSPVYWLEDGVHPTPMGHELIKREWLAVFQQIL